VLGKQLMNMGMCVPTVEPKLRSPVLLHELQQRT
jgi:hypothetical protein